jgi:hypothetical protein
LEEPFKVLGYDKFAQEKKWRNSLVRPEWMLPTIIEGLEKQAQWCVRIIQPSLLLPRMCGRWVQSGNKPTLDQLGVLGGVGEYGGKNPDVGFDYSPLSWEQLCIVAFRCFEKHGEVRHSRKRLFDAGIETYWVADAYNATATLDLKYMIDAKSVAGIRNLAKQDLNLKTKSQSDEFDRLLDLYLIQNYGSEAERLYWKTREPPVAWPIPKFET